MNTKLRREQIVGGADGWNRFLLPLAFSSVDNPTGVINLTGANTLLSVGMRVKFTNGGNTTYGIVTAVSANSFTFLHQMNTNGNGNAVNLMQNSEITDASFSFHKAPFGFPLNPNSWSVEFSDSSPRNQTPALQNVWYNLGSSMLSVPVGIWRIFYMVVADIVKSSQNSPGLLQVTLSTLNDSESDVKMTSSNFVTGSGTGIYIQQFYIGISRECFISLDSKTNYYLNIRTQSDLSPSIQFRGERGNTIIRATCAYL